MKKLFSILFAALILLSGMHLSLATHLCGGEVSAVKLSFTHQKAACGMCAAEQNTATTQTLSTESCCKDEMAFYVVDNTYSPSTLQINLTANQLLQVFDIPQTIGIQSIHTNSALHTNIQPPNLCMANAVSLPDICVFRI